MFWSRATVSGCGFWDSLCLSRTGAAGSVGRWLKLSLLPCAGVLVLGLSQGLETLKPRGGRPQRSLPRRPQASSALAPGAALGLSPLAFSHLHVRSSSELPFFFFSSSVLQNVKGHRELLQRCWQSCSGGVSVEQDEGDAHLMSRCGSARTCSSRRDCPGTEESRAALLGGSREKGGTKVQALEGGGAGKKLLRGRSTAADRAPGVGNWD